jgi:peptidoglycan/LPS O-acetylase OafA/YrhL
LSQVHFPGFDGLRLFAASAVLVTHGALIARGPAEGDLVLQLTGYGIYGVHTFFIISGFLLANSLNRGPGDVQFAVNRLLRIYPGIVFCALMTVLFLAPLGSSLSWGQYFSDSTAIITYVQHTLTCLCGGAELPGVFAYDGALNREVNGVLWSLGYEVRSYLLLLMTWVALGNIAAVGILFSILGVTAVVSNLDPLVSVDYTLPFFAGGVAMFLIYNRYGVSGRMAIFCAGGLILAFFLGVLWIAYAVFGSYLIVFLGNRSNVGSKMAARVGDLSYGIYLYHWPVAQLVKQFYPTENAFLLILIVLPFVLVLSLLSFRLIEGPALRLKRPIGRLFSFGEGNKAAKAAFLLSGAFILFSPAAYWWFLTQSVVEIAAWTAVGTISSVVVVRTFRIFSNSDTDANVR